MMEKWVEDPAGVDGRILYRVEVDEEELERRLMVLRRAALEIRRDRLLEQRAGPEPAGSPLPARPVGSGSALCCGGQAPLAASVEDEQQAVLVGDTRMAGGRGGLRGSR